MNDLTNVVAPSEGKDVSIDDDGRPFPSEQIKCFGLWVLVRKTCEPNPVLLRG